MTSCLVSSMAEFQCNFASICVNAEALRAKSGSCNSSRPREGKKTLGGIASGCANCAAAGQRLLQADEAARRDVAAGEWAAWLTACTGKKPTPPQPRTVAPVQAAAPQPGGKQQQTGSKRPATGTNEAGTNEASRRQRACTPGSKQVSSLTTRPYPSLRPCLARSHQPFSCT